ncbi:MAG: hypothetical protein KKD01_19970 [Proteobacteria bacterium]|nr:hypothetical protein [Pseudomonadota bacterium]
MGVLDERTARKHLSRFAACINDFIILLAKLIAQYGDELPNEKPAKSVVAVAIKWFIKLASKIITIREKLFGFENLHCADIAWMFGFFIHKAYPCATCQAEKVKDYFSIFSRAPPDYVCTFSK